MNRRSSAGSRCARNRVVVVLFTTMALLLGACGNDEPTDPAEEGISGTVVVYTSESPTGWRVLGDAFRERHPQTEFEVVRLDSSAIVERFFAESESGAQTADIIADALFVIVPTDFWQDYIVPYEAADVEGVEDEYVGPDHFYHTYGIFYQGLCVNTEVLEAENLPTPERWEDLADPAYEGQISSQDIRKPGASSQMMMELRGIWDDDEKWEEVFSGMGENEPIFTPDLIQAQQMVVRGEVAVNFACLPDRIWSDIEAGAPVEFIPPDPTLPIGTALGLTKQAEGSDAAKALIDFVLSEEGQEIVSTELQLGSIRPEIPLPESAAAVEGEEVILTPSDYYLDEFANNMDFYNRKIKEWFGLE